ncbi:MAG TPA: 1-acyl-sn-glycerol-3-phosphate acyltransferase, partial [Ochrobactrum sp.]|nr:1-acyl-sn-glycerol-3-phosphate acyltransferase [Ochrobactrum sp.]
MLLYLRSILFNIAFYIGTLVQMILYTPFYFLLPRKKAWIVPKTWARVNLWLQK